jgi:uncharacterized protein YhbP (UPF0306 family)
MVPSQHRFIEPLIDIIKRDEYKIVLMWYHDHHYTFYKETTKYHYENGIYWVFDIKTNVLSKVTGRKSKNKKMYLKNIDILKKKIILHELKK